MCSICQNGCKNQVAKSEISDVAKQCNYAPKFVQFLLNSKEAEGHVALRQLMHLCRLMKIDERCENLTGRIFRKMKVSLSKIYSLSEFTGHVHGKSVNLL